MLKTLVACILLIAAAEGISLQINTALIADYLANVNT